MSYEFDFNINNYSISELENFLSLDKNYDFNAINEKCSKMNLIIIESKDYDKIYKTRLGKFLEEAKLRLVKNIKEMSEGNDGFMEDYNKLLTPDDHIVNQTTTIQSGNNFVMNKETVTLNDVIDREKKLEPIGINITGVQRGILNPLKRNIFLQTIVLNTLFREDYFGTTSTDFSIVLPYYFKNVLAIRLSSLQLPNVIYCISKFNGNNTFYIEEDNTGIKGTITFPDGNYLNINDFCTLLQTQINTQLGISPDRFIVGVDVNSGLINISNNTNNFTIVFYEPIVENVVGSYRIIEPTKGQRQQNCVELEEIYKKFGWIIGFRKAYYTGSNNYTTEGVYNGAYPNYIYFSLNDFNNSQAQQVFGMYSKSIIGDNILAMIPITAPSFYVNFTNGADLIDKRRIYFGQARIQRLKIQLLNQYGDIINLNNMDYSFSLELEIGYDF